MSIDAIKSPFGSIGTVKPFAPVSQPQGPDKVSGSGESFKDMFTKAIKEVDGLQKEADGKIEGVLLGKPGATPHDAMIALEKADSAFQLMNTLRSRIIRAYEEIMRVQI